MIKIIKQYIKKSDKKLLYGIYIYIYIGKDEVIEKKLCFVKQKLKLK